MEDEEEMLRPYGQGLAEDSENSDSQGVVVQGTESPVEALSENMLIPEPAPSTSEPAPSTSVESTTGASGRFTPEFQQILQMLQSFQQENKADKQKQEENRQRDKVEIVEMLSQKLEQNQQTLAEKLEQNQQKLEEKQEQIREEIKVQATEINKVREECHKKYDQLEKRFSSEIAAGIRQVNVKISRTEETTGKELRALKGQIEMDRRINNENNLGMQQQVNEIGEKSNNHETSINNITSELGNLKVNIQQVDSELGNLKLNIQQGNQRAEKEEEEHQRRLRESNQRLECKIQQTQEKVTQEISKLEREVVALKSNLCDSAEIRTFGTSIAVPSTSQEPVSREPVQSPPEEIATIEGSKGVQGISSGEFPLPLFDENASVNPVAHLRHLEEFFIFRGIHKKHWLTVAKRSIGGSMSRQWLEATSSKFTNYEQFKKEFLSTWWSAAQQGLTKCHLYQSKFDPSEGLSLSAHFLKHVTAASYLEPKLSDCETIEAIRCHYSP
jgi:uncharacterized phage infection (PIP) family protein YhgE